MKRFSCHSLLPRLAGLSCVSWCLFLPAARAFDVVALVDSLDFAKNFDVETPAGTVQVLEHVLLVHPTDIWWRDKGGGRMRYPSACETWQVSEAPFDKKRLPSEDIYGWLRLEAPRSGEQAENEGRVRRTYTVFLLGSLALTSVSYTCILSTVLRDHC